LANSEDVAIIKVLEKYFNSSSEEVRVTCQLGAKKLETYELLKEFDNFKRIKKNIFFFCLDDMHANIRKQESLQLRLMRKRCKKN